MVFPPIIIDTREQLPYEFENVVYQTLKTGDYSIQGLEDHVAIERKRHEEFINCLSNDRERFLKELQRGESLRILHIVVEASFNGVLNCSYDDWPSEMHPNAIKGTIAAWANRYPWVRFWFPGDRETARAWTKHLLERSWKDYQEKKIKEGKPSGNQSINGRA